ncbi:MAG: Fic family protein [Methylophilaceae bacterium]
MEPLVFEPGAAMLATSYELAVASARLAASLHPLSAQAVAGLVSNMNCYYSNLIEGHDTKPADIERAMLGDYSAMPEKRVLQLEARAHIEVEQKYLGGVVQCGHSDIFQEDLILGLHRDFYSGLPEDLHWVLSPDGKAKLKVEPGKLRQTEVQVGLHYPPQHQALPAFMARFCEFYKTAWAGKLPYQRLPLVAATHHRLLWIHPFLDGNGRVARLFSVLAMKAAGIEGVGLWSPARGLARRVDEYKSLLQDADSQRRGDLDGRGNLSIAALEKFSGFYIDTCLDQVKFMSDMFQMDKLTSRIEYFFGVMSATTSLRKESYLLVAEAIRRGEFARGEAQKISGLGERVARDTLSELLTAGFLKSDSPKGAVRAAFPAAATGYYFPNLFPAGSPEDVHEYIARKKS